jgi:isopenicillin-N N-acyltransferase like protein
MEQNLAASRLQVVEASGSNYDMGYEHGTKCSQKIRRFSEIFIREAVQRTGMGVEKVHAVANLYLPLMERSSPHLVEEMRGIAAGGGVSLEDVLLLNLRHEFMFGLRTKQWTNCTSVGLTSELSSTGASVIAQNVDLPPYFHEYMVLLRLKPRSGPRLMMYTAAGTVGNHGINSYGLARSSNALASKREKALGVSRVVLSRLILQQRSTEDSLDTISRADRAVSGNYMLTDSRGDLVDVESTADDIRTLRPTNGFLVHTNHILHPDIAETDTGVAEDTYERYTQMTKAVSNHKGRVTPEDVEGWLRDHTGYPGSVCNHSSLTSVAALVLLPAEGKMLVCHGPPCKNEFQDFAISS